MWSSNSPSAMAIGIPGERHLDLHPAAVLAYGYTGKEDDPANEKF